VVVLPEPVGPPTSIIPNGFLKVIGISSNIRLKAQLASVKSQRAVLFLMCPLAVEFPSSSDIYFFAPNLEEN
jgi:hypothetical protein